MRIEMAVIGKKSGGVVRLGEDAVIDTYIMNPVIAFMVISIAFAALFLFTSSDFLYTVYCDSEMFHLNEFRFIEMEKFRYGLGCKWESSLIFMASVTIPFMIYLFVASLKIFPNKYEYLHELDCSTVLVVIFWMIFYTYIVFFSEIKHIPERSFAIRNLANSPFMLFATTIYFSFMAGLLVQLLAAIVRRNGKKRGGNYV